VRKPRTFLCGGAKAEVETGHVSVPLDTTGPERNVNLRLEDVAKVMTSALNPRVLDFLELAAYIYAADSSVARDTGWLDQASTEPWGREFTFHVAVRDPIFWSDPRTIAVLTRLLKFLSDDAYNFHFHQMEHSLPVQMYLELGDLQDWPFYGVDRVLMFSGGLDSLAGAVDTAASGSPLVLVSHRPVAALSKRQQDLFTALRSGVQSNMIRIPVWVNKESGLGRDFSQRTRSFLFAALGTAVAESVQAEGLRFFENGIVSLNLPVADEVLRSRASRTTHPMSLAYLAELCSLVIGRNLAVDNPYIHLTKTEVLEQIRDHGASKLIMHTVSCAHYGIHQSSSRRHCGTCSQCIDRRVAVLASGQSDYDPQDDYVSEVFTGPRQPRYEQNMATDYVRHALELNGMADEEMAARFNLEFSQAVRHEERRGASVQAYIAMHKRHASSVDTVVKQQMTVHSAGFVDGTLCDSSLLALVAGQRHRESIWRRYAERIVHMLASGLPVACKSHPPKNEPHLQEICDGILRGQESLLIREFPYLRWSSSATKPDWSAEALSLWVELKFVRQASDIRQITEDIAADITKYGDNQRHVLFVIYDPEHLVVDEPSFASDISAHEGMIVRFIR
jgi:REase_DpnII-MboI/Queuosine biosynthesis protein QueC